MHRAGWRVVYQEHAKAAGSVFEARFDIEGTVRNYLSFFAETRAARG